MILRSAAIMVRDFRILLLFSISTSSALQVKSICLATGSKPQRLHSTKTTALSTPSKMSRKPWHMYLAVFDQPSNFHILALSIGTPFSCINNSERRTQRNNCDEKLAKPQDLDSLHTLLRTADTAERQQLSVGHHISPSTLTASLWVGSLPL